MCPPIPSSPELCFFLLGRYFFSTVTLNIDNFKLIIFHILNNLFLWKRLFRLFWHPHTYWLCLDAWAILQCMIKSSIAGTLCKFPIICKEQGNILRITIQGQSNSKGNFFIGFQSHENHKVTSLELPFKDTSN